MFEQNTHLAAEITAVSDMAEDQERPAASLPRSTGNPGYQLPARVWGTMLACYGIFFLAIFAATGSSGHARFAIIVSVLYTAMYFGVARIIAKIGGQEARSPLDRGQSLQTDTGPMNKGAVYSQVLIVPMVLVLFGVGMAVIIGIAA